MASAAGAVTVKPAATKATSATSPIRPAKASALILEAANFIPAYVIDHIGFPVSSNSLRAVSGIVTAAAAPN